MGHFSNLELLAGGGVWGRVTLGWVVLAVGFTLAPQPGSVGRTYMKLAIVIFFSFTFLLVVLCVCFPHGQAGGGERSGLGPALRALVCAPSRQGCLTPQELKTTHLALQQD